MGWHGLLKADSRSFPISSGPEKQQAYFRMGATLSNIPPACPYCAATPTSFWFRKPGLGGEGAYSIFKCHACVSAFVFPFLSNDELQRFYTGPTYVDTLGLTAQSAVNLEIVLAQERSYPNAVLDAERIAKGVKALATGRSFLDIGSGYGFFSRAARAAGFDVDAIEVNAESRRVFREMNGFEAVDGMLDHEFANHRVERYGVVLLSQVLEHMCDVNSVVPDLRRMLAPRGVCVVAVPHFGSLISWLQGRNDMFITPPEHLNYFSRTGLSRLFLRYGFECCRMETISRFDESRLRRKLRVPGLRALAAATLTVVLAAADKADRGMMLNAYFRKI
jgi:SAM-dependent methyltransferase